MNKKIFRCFLSLFASALLAHAAHAENKATFMVFTPCYYEGDVARYESAQFPRVVDAVDGNFGPYTSLESFPTTITYYLNGNVPAGYAIKEWKLCASSGSNVVKSQEGGTAFTAAFDYKWAAKYGTTFNLIVYLEPITYTLSYNANGGDWTAGEPEGGEYKGNDEVTAPGVDSVEKDNYTLTGWTTKGGGGSLIEPGGTFTGTDLGVTNRDQKVVLYAQWGVATYKVTMAVPNGAKLKNSSAKKTSSDTDWDYYTTTYTYGKGMTLPTATKSNSKFEGWYDNPQLISNVVTKITTTDSGNKEFWAKFIQQDTVVHYNGNGATSGNMADSTFVYNQQLPLKENTFKRAYTVTYIDGDDTIGTDTATYTFREWNSKPNGSGAYTYYDKQDVANPCDSTGDAVTLYAMWDEDPVTVTLPTPQRTGSEFEGWFVSGDIRVGGAGDKYEPSHDITLVAHWKGEKTYTIHFSPNADVTNPGAIADRVGKLGDAIGALPDGNDFNNLASTGFDCWEYNGVKVEELFSYTPINDGETVLLKARWKGCGKLSDAVGLKNAVLTNVVSETWTNKEDAIFGQTAYNKNSEMAMSVFGSGVVQFWSKGTGLCTLHYKIDNGTSNKIPLTDGYKLIDPIKISDEDGNGRNVHALTLWLEGMYGICYIKNMTWTADHPDRTIAAVSNPTSAGTVTGGGAYNIGDTAKLTATATGGSTFVRWSDGSTDAAHTVDVTCDETYQAVFSGGGGTETSNYYILFDGNGAYKPEAMDGQKMLCGTATALDANKFTRSGFKFAGWATTRYGKVAYADKAAVNLSSKENDVITLYAAWEETSTPTPGPTPGPEPEPEPGVYVSSVGEAVEVDLAGDYSGYTIKSVSGLPTGLKYNKKTGYVTGTPTKAVSKENNVTLKFSDKTTTKVTWTVEALPTMMVGTYYGAAVVDGIAGQFQLKLAATGKATGYFYAASKKISFKSTGLVDLGNGYALTVSYTYNRTKCTDEILLAKAATVNGVDIWSAALGSDSEAMDDAESRRDTIKEVFGKAVSKTKTYDIEDETFEEGEYLKAKVSTAGAVTVSGKLLSDASKLTAVSCSTHLVVDDEGKAYCWITIYKTVRGKEPIERCFQWYLPED